MWRAPLCYAPDERTIQMPHAHTSRRRTATAIAVTIVVALSVALVAQRRQFFGAPRFEPGIANLPYDGRFTFVRLRYTTSPGGYWYGGQPAWAHGYNISELNLMRIMNEVSYLGAHDDESNAIALDDPILGRYPIAYVIEPDWSTISDLEAQALRAYLQKGGFLIVDDFKLRGGRGSNGEGGGWATFAAIMQRVMPGGRFVDLDKSHPVFHAFFEIRSLEDFPQAYIGGRPVFRGLFEDNDPSKRLQVVVNYNTDISQYWEWSGRGFKPFDDTNEAYKLGVNYILYGLTH